MQRYKSGDIQGALDKFLQSRTLYAAANNTLNAAKCLAEVGRSDEAIELYEEVLTQFRERLTPEDKASIKEAIARLIEKVGSIEITANVPEFIVLIDDRRIRSGGRLWMLGGIHSLKIVRAGYEPIDMRVRIDTGASVKRTFVLKPIAGILRVEADTRQAGYFDVFVDGVRVGKTPWEGQVQPGKHIVWIGNLDFGSMPTPIAAVSGQPKVVRLHSLPLGPPLSVMVEPPTAELSLENSFLGSGRWIGRLPQGLYTLVATEPGYRPRQVPLRVGQDARPLVVRLKLEVDLNHPRWRKPKRGFSWLAADAGIAWAPSLGSGAEAGCPKSCTNHRGAVGFLGGVIGGNEFSSGVAFEMEAGFMSLEASFDRVFKSGVEYELHDKVQMAGPFASAGASYVFSRKDRLMLSGGMHLGVAIVSSQDPVTASVTFGDTTTTFPLEGAGTLVRSAAIFLMSDITAVLRTRPIAVGLGMHIGGVLQNGPKFDYVLDASVLRGERAYGPFILISPQLRVGYVFR